MICAVEPTNVVEGQIAGQACLRQGVPHILEIVGATVGAGAGIVRIERQDATGDHGALRRQGLDRAVGACEQTGVEGRIDTRRGAAAVVRLVPHLPVGHPRQGGNDAVGGGDVVADELIGPVLPGGSVPEKRRCTRYDRVAEEPDDGQPGLREHLHHARVQPEHRVIPAHRMIEADVQPHDLSADRGQLLHVAAIGIKQGPCVRPVEQLIQGESYLWHASLLRNVTMGTPPIAVLKKAAAMDPTTTDPGVPSRQ